MLCECYGGSARQYRKAAVEINVEPACNLFHSLICFASAQLYGVVAIKCAHFINIQAESSSVLTWLNLVQKLQTWGWSHVATTQRVMAAQ